MSHVTHWAPYKAGAAIAGHRLARITTSDREARQGAGAGEPLVGVSGSQGVAADETVEIAIAGIADVEYGAAVTRGQLLTSDASGKAVPVSGAGVTLVHATGAAAATNIAVTGILTTDEIVGVAATDGTATGAVTIHSDGNIRCANSTASKNLIVAFRRPAHFAGVAVVSGVDGDIGEVILTPGVK